MKTYDKGQIGEELVNSIADLTFFKNWCFPSPKDSNNEKEICDLLIIFRDVVFIISVKNYEFKGNYERYFNNTLKKAISQIHGAERKLFESKRIIEIVNQNNESLSFDPANYKYIFRIIVNHSVSPNFYPATTYTKAGNLVHIFNWEAFYKTLKELDTISDLVSYIIARSNLFEGKKSVILNGNKKNWDLNTSDQFKEYLDKCLYTEPFSYIVSGSELDLLSTYLSNQRSFPIESEKNENNVFYFEIENQWNIYIKRIEVERKKEADNISYLIDEFIKRDILFYNDKQRKDIAIEILSLTRHQRRHLGIIFDDFLKKYVNCGDFLMARRFSTFGNTTIGFFIHGNGINLEQSMELMNIAILGYAYYENYKSDKIIIIGTNADFSQWKFAFATSTSKLNKKDEEDLIHNLKALNWFTNIKKSKIESEEYPDK
jgi:hypothetical protein